MNPEQLLSELTQALHTTVVGYDDVIRKITIALVLRGHLLLEGVPGVAKTLLAKSVAAALDLTFKRIQFTPDMMPADITGTTLFDFQKGTFTVQPGPIFTDILLADEINRTPPKTQAALLEAMEERQVTLEGKPRPLPEPFFVIATQNPIEYEGTYPLPEAQVDRFFMKLVMDYLPPEEEKAVYTRPAGLQTPIRPVAGVQDLQAVRSAFDAVHADETLLVYLSSLVQATRINPRLRLGCSPRGAQFLLAAARAEALFSGRDYVIPDDIKSAAPDVLRHRLLLDPEAQLEGVTPEKVLDGILQTVSATAS